MILLEKLACKLEGREMILVMPEGSEGRMLSAARILRDRQLARIVLLGPLPDIEAA